MKSARIVQQLASDAAGDRRIIMRCNNSNTTSTVPLVYVLRSLLLTQRVKLRKQKTCIDYYYQSRFV